MRATMRAAKAVTKGYSDAQSKVRDATKNDTSSPTARELDDIAHLTYSQIDFVEMMEILDKRLNDKGKLWRHVYKALIVVDHLLYNGSPQVFHYCHNNIYVFKTLREFQYIDDNGVDVGQNVRAEAREVTRLLMSPDVLKRERNGGRRNYDDPIRTSSETRRSEERKSSQEKEEARRRRQQMQKEGEDEEMKKAIELSKQAEEERLRKIRESNNGGLFDESSAKPADNVLIDLSDELNATVPVQIQYTQIPLQTQYTSYPNTLQQQFTSFDQPFVQPQYTAVYSSFQPTGNPYQYQYTGQQEAMQAEYARQRAEWQQQQQIQQWQQQTQLLTPPQSTPSQSPMPQTLSPQPTAFKIGSNNPFASNSSTTSSPMPSTSSPYQPTPSPSLTSTTTESERSRMSPATPFSTRSRSRASPHPSVPAGRVSAMGKVGDERYRTLEGLYQGRVGNGEEGVDTFGNVGDLRLGPQATGVRSV
ncbi:hypothetical protein BDY19DRAFT_935724 [Irpex rosettiformis]|uniref:Uncharacterized protein n=1 Tax=Irpex rosettiformis TaxID=378272 RepID=A0ACB8U898_9APHY|nr:hypothetical protein BDY19DRAFT_935724 [Irpex rosettiformis]